MTDIKHYEQSMVNVKKLIPYANNSRTHSEDQVKQIAASIKEWGFTNPILIDDEMTIIAGHGRVLAAEVLQLEEVPCIMLTGLTPAQKKAYVIADNKIALNAGWDYEMLQVEMEGLADMDYEVDLLGFDEGEIDALFPDDDEPTIKDEPEPKAKERLVVITCISEHEQQKIYNEMQKRGLQVKMMD